MENNGRIETTDSPQPAAAPLELWVVVSSTSRSTVMVAKSEEHANAVAVCNNHDYPSLAPYRAVRMVEAQA